MGLDVPEFDHLYERIESGYEEYERKRLSRRHRKREVVGGSSGSIRGTSYLLMLLASSIPPKQLMLKPLFY
ncbi:MAG: hypothetical protein ACUVTL_02565 [Thermoproteota archaeon]